MKTISHFAYRRTCLARYTLATPLINGVRVKTIVCKVFIVLCVLVCSCRPLLNLRETNSCAWVCFHEETTVIRNGYKMVQRFDSSTYVRSVYIQRKTDKKPILFYTHGRRIEAILGHQGQLALINDYFATKACKVMVADIDSAKNWPIDQTARKQHMRIAPKQWLPHYAIPKAIAFSPDDKMVLIVMKSGYIAGTVEEAREFGKRFKLWSYVVDSTNATVLHTYQTNGIVPCDWWKF